MYAAFTVPSWDTALLKIILGLIAWLSERSGCPGLVNPKTTPYTLVNAVLPS